MKKKFLLLPLLCGAFVLSSCSFGIVNTTVVEKEVIVTEAEEVEVIQIKNTISDVYKEAVKSCVGIQTTTASGVGTGSGVVYKKDAATNTYYVVTNAHVVEGYTDVKVFDGNEIYYTGNVLGYDTKNDVAVVTFTTDIIGASREFKPVDLMDAKYPDIVTVGQTALAIGCPLSLTDNYNSLSVGVVSGYDYQEVKTDAALNPGNSGGGLFNMEGRLIGLVNSKTVWTTQMENGVSTNIPVEGRGYAIALDIVKSCIKDIEALGGEITRPVFGIYVTNFNTLVGGSVYDKWKDYLPEGDSRYSYIVVTEFNEVSAGKTCGLEVGDIILEINGNPVTKNTDISDVLYTSLSTDTVTLKIYRKSLNSTKDIVITWS